MSTSIDQAFVKQYQREVHEAYQRHGSKLRGTVRTVTSVKGSTVTFQKIGSGVAGTKARHGLVPVMNLAHTNATATLVDYYAGEYVDKLDELKINHDERGAIARAQAWAIGRKTDELIIAALEGSSNTTTIDLTSEGSIRNTLLNARAALLDRDVPLDGQVFGVISPSIEKAFLTVEEFASADYVGDEFPYRSSAGRIRTWLDIHWIMHTGLSKDGNNVRTGVLYHKSAVGHAIAADMSMMVDWVPERAAYFLDAMMSQGAVTIDTNGLQELALDEDTALPTS